MCKMLYQEKQVDWFTLPRYQTHGLAVYKQEVGWYVDEDSPLFTSDREFTVRLAWVRFSGGAEFVTAMHLQAAEIAAAMPSGASSITVQSAGGRSILAAAVRNSSGWGFLFFTSLPVM